MMRFCLSLTSHYSILHLTGSASFTDDPFYKCFPKKFLLAGNVEFSNLFVLSIAQTIWVLFHIACLTKAICLLCCAETNSVSCRF